MKNESKNAYQVVTDKIIALLETGKIPWRQPWSEGAGLGDNQNLMTQHQYKGVNALLTGCQGYLDPYWLTYRQAQELGGTVKKGEKGTPIVFFKFGVKEESDGEEKKWAMAKYSVAFNVAQCEIPGLDKILDKQRAKRKADRIQFTPLERCEKVLKGFETLPKIQHVEQRAYYRPATDTVNMPKQVSFESIEKYYAVLFHELTHSTGAENRLNRNGITEKNFFGSHEYSKEELVAEMGAAFLCHHTGIDTVTIENSAAYIHSWLRRLKDDPRLLMAASSQAQKAVDFILNKKEETKKC